MPLSRYRGNARRPCEELACQIVLVELKETAENVFVIAHFAGIDLKQLPARPQIE